MEVPSHNTHHQRAQRLPVTAQTARVTAVEPLDERRSDEIRDAVRRLLDRYGKDEWIDAVVGDDGVDWADLWERVHGDPDHSGVLEKKLATLEDRAERTFPSLVRIALETPEPFAFVPGEYLTVRYGDVPRPYSIAASPNSDELEICVRRVPGGRLSTELCGGLSAGDDLSIRGPFGGDFVLANPSERDLAFLATGTGVAPFRSMIEYVFEEGLDEHEGTTRNVWLFLGASWKDDLPYREEFRKLADERENFRFVPTCSRETYLSDWEGETAYVQRTFAKYLEDSAVDSSGLADPVARRLGEPPRTDIEARIDPNRLECYVCGVSVMAYGVLDVARNLGIPERHVRVEGYG